VVVGGGGGRAAGRHHRRRRRRRRRLVVNERVTAGGGEATERGAHAVYTDRTDGRTSVVRRQSSADELRPQLLMFITRTVHTVRIFSPIRCYCYVYIL